MTDELKEQPRRANILRYWRAVEMFSAQSIDKPNPQEDRYRIGEGKPIPWHFRKYRSRPSDKTIWQHHMYGGIFRLDRLHYEFASIFGESGIDVDERVPRGYSALFAIAITEEGRILLESPVFSMAAWALGQTKKAGPHALDRLLNFEATIENLKLVIRELLAADEDDAQAAHLLQEGISVSRPLTIELLNHLVRALAKSFGVSNWLTSTEIWANSKRISRDDQYEPQIDFLNSFFIDDLEKVAKASLKPTSTLAALLNEDEAPLRASRINIRHPEQQSKVFEILSPKNVPEGRWPAKISHSLATSQQLAVNAIFQTLSERAGAFAVNGPPGTGKTTMLRDIIAGVVVKRAQVLAKLEVPEQGFGPRRPAWRTRDYSRYISPLKPELTGFEMLVASANNGAIDNVTKEIPSLRSIDKTWVERANYYAEDATRVLEEPAWGLMAAALGNKKNCDKFFSRFWFTNFKKNSGIKDAEIGFEARLKALKRGQIAPLNWSEAVSHFRSAIAQEKALRSERQTLHEHIKNLIQPALIQEKELALNTVLSRQKDHQTAKTQAETRHTSAQKSMKAALEHRAEHFATKPGFWEMLFTWGSAIRKWHLEDVPFAKEVKAAKTLEEQTRQDLEKKEHEGAKLSQEIASLQAELDEFIRIRTYQEHQLETARVQFGNYMPDKNWMEDRCARELYAPWLDEAWNQARVEVFLAALTLHQAFVEGAASILYENLKTAMDVLKRKAPRDAPSSSITMAWQSLFMVVPVVSTTFASISRLMGPLGAESIGWLFIDEAGQALPQAAAGAIWRTKRSVVVGDPLQLEPVSSALHTTEASLMKYFGTSDRWLPGRTSVQELADRISPLGTELPGEDGQNIWVGSPLVVHRRCEEPMFSIVNNMVYDGLMVFGTPDRPAPLKSWTSHWLDIQPRVNEGHWVNQEGDIAQKYLRYFGTQGISPEQIMIVTPFKDVAYRLNQLIYKLYPSFPKKNIQLVEDVKRPLSGTVHTAQGKEAEVVLFILGGDPRRSGAKQWATSKPNLFNVAISRAKQRIYILGDYQGWSQWPYFKGVDEYLSIIPYTPSEIVKTTEVDISQDLC